MIHKSTEFDHGSVLNFCRLCVLEGCYYVNDIELRYLVQNHQNIKKLNVNHCYWLSPKILQWTVHRCKNLHELHLLECRLRIETVISLISSCRMLKSLSFSVGSFADMKLEIFLSAKETLSLLKSLTVCYTSKQSGPNSLMYTGEHHTMLDLCTSLYELHILASGRPVYEIYRPIIAKPDGYANLCIMTITDYVHSGAQMLFYGSLSQIHNDGRPWTCLLMPNLNFKEFQAKSEFAHCLSNVENLQQLDVSGSRDVVFPNHVIDLSLAHRLSYLNVASTSVDSAGLFYVSEYCTNLVSLNLFGCSKIFQMVKWLLCNI